MLVSSKIINVFKHDKFLIGMIHLRGISPEDRLARAKKEIDIYIDNGFDAVLVEDYFGSYKDVIEVLKYIKNKRPEIIYGVNILNDYPIEGIPMPMRNYRMSFRLAKDYNAKFVQLDSVSGHLSTLGRESADYYFEQDLIHLKQRQPELIVLGGVRFKGQPVLSNRGLKQDVFVASRRADAIVTTGLGTGIETPIEKLLEIRKYLCENVPIITGAGVNQINCRQQLAIVNGAIIGSACKDTLEAYGEVNPDNVEIIANAVKVLR